jgi:hypothetical protein
MSGRIDPPGAGAADGESEGAGLSVEEKFAKLVAEFDGSTVSGKGAKEESARTRRLRDGSLADFTDLLDPKSSIPAQLAKDMAHPSCQDDPTTLVTRFDPKATVLLGHTVKVSGTMSESVGTQRDTVRLTANYLFVYAVAPAAGPATTSASWSTAPWNSRS